MYCFNLQFRKDVKKNRPHSPTYYRWTAQFIVLGALNEIERIKEELGCGRIHNNRFSVQSIDEIIRFVLPYFHELDLEKKKKNDFELWEEAVNIIFKNKRKSLQKKDHDALLEIHGLAKKYKEKPKPLKWI